MASAAVMTSEKTIPNYNSREEAEEYVFRGVIDHKNCGLLRRFCDSIRELVKELEFAVTDDGFLVILLNISFSSWF